MLILAIDLGKYNSMCLVYDAWAKIQSFKLLYWLARLLVWRGN